MPPILAALPPSLTQLSLQLPGLGNAALQQLLHGCCPRLQQLQLFCGSSKLTAAGLQLLGGAGPALHAVTLLVPASNAAHVLKQCEAVRGFGQQQRVSLMTHCSSKAADSYEQQVQQQVQSLVAGAARRTGCSSSPSDSSVAAGSDAAAGEPARQQCHWQQLCGQLLAPHLLDASDGEVQLSDEFEAVRADAVSAGASSALGAAGASCLRVVPAAHVYLGDVVQDDCGLSGDDE